MSDDIFRFAMGEFEATFPNNYLYAKNHMWAKATPGETNSFRFGLTAYAVRLLQDVYFLDWIVDPPVSLTLRQTIGSIESKKAESDLFSPIAGMLREINSLVLDDPSLINADPYGDGWMLEIELDGSVEELLTPDQYQTHLIEAWDIAQKTIKGQANQ